MLTIRILTKKPAAKLQNPNESGSLWHNIRKAALFLNPLIRPVTPKRQSSLSTIQYLKIKLTPFVLIPSELHFAF